MAPPAQKAPQSFAELGTPVKLLIGVMLVGLLGAVYYFALHAPLVEEIEAAEARHAQLMAELGRAQQRQAEFLRVRAELDARAALDQQNRRVLPDRAEMPAFLQNLHRLAEVGGLRFETVEPRPEEPDARFVKVPVALRFVGRYHQVARFFYNVSKLDRAISMEDVSLTSPREVGEEVLVTVEVRATTYRRPDAAAAGAQASAAGVAGAARASGGGAR
jgi:type IV pilus assembly protein PilO